MPTTFFEAVRGFQREIGAVGGHVFSAPNASDGIMDRHQFDKWLTVAEAKAELLKLGWQPVARIPQEMGN